MSMRRSKWRFKTTPYVNPWCAFISSMFAVLVVAMFGLFPAILNLVISLTNYNGLWSSTQFVGLSNYILFLTSAGGKDMLNAFWVTIKYALMIVIPNNVIALLVAMLVNKGLFGSKFFRALFFMPSILGVVVVTSAWKLIFDPYRGPIAALLEPLGITSSFLGGDSTALLCVVIIALWASFGYSMVLYYAGLQSIDRTYYEAGEMDGVGPFQKLIYITLPLLKPYLVICYWIGISGALGVSDYIILTTMGGHGTTTIGFYIYNIVISNPINQGQSAAVSNYNFIFVTAIMLLYNYLTGRKEKKEEAQ